MSSFTSKLNIYGKKDKCFGSVFKLSFLLYVVTNYIISIAEGTLLIEKTACQNKFIKLVAMLFSQSMIIVS